MKVSKSNICFTPDFKLNSKKCIGESVHDLVVKILIPTLTYISERLDFYLPTQHKGLRRYEYLFPGRMSSLDFDQTDIFVSKLLKK